MAHSFQRLQNVLQLEAKQGYKNTAVVGGIRQFITFWVSQAREEAQSEVDKAFIEQTAELLSDYANLPGWEARARVVDRLLEKLEERAARAPKPTPAPPARKPAPPPPAPQPTSQPTSQPISQPTNQPTSQPIPKPAEPTTPPITEPTPPPPPKPTPKPSPKPATPDPQGLRQPVSQLHGVGPRIGALLNKLGAYSIGDLLYLFPRRYDDYSAMKPINRLEYGEQVTVIGTVWEVRAQRNRQNQTVIHAVVSDGTGKIQVTWFNQPWLINKLKANLRIVLQGKVEKFLGRLIFNNPDWEMLSLDSLRTGNIVPIYPLTQGLGSHRLRQMMRGVVEEWSPRLPDPLPLAVRERQNLVSLPEAIYQTHLPGSQEELLAARRRLVFDELFLLQLGMLGQKRQWQGDPARPCSPHSPLREQFIQQLPYSLTNAQQRVISEITADMAKDVPMNRLLQGDVGAGKTVVAAAAMLTAVSGLGNGTQSALMAPTEILAEQHYQGLRQLLEPLGLQLTLLTGSLGTAAKRAAQEAIADGSAQLIIGTHALIQSEVSFANLGLAVIDEQHRFGVDQRAALRHKGPDGLTPHLLVMSATPIPRTLALSLYGDLDFSALDEMPPGRQEIKTHWLRPRERERAYAFVRGQAQQGRQAYIICPLVEESDKIEAVAAVEEHARLQTEIFPDLRLGLVHGKLPSAEKEATMRQFKNGELDVLVATSVIEVGVDVPNSTVMMIEGANRFGLAQLHQFRGRVGRGQHQSYCLLMADETTPEAEDRLTALEQTNDGFQLAEKDLELRGPGEFFGRRQSGLPELRLASLTDMTMLQLARQEAAQLIATDPNLDHPDHRLLQERVQTFWATAGDVS
jgi:ATP-dependent DNA helicase RecG